MPRLLAPIEGKILFLFSRKKKKIGMKSGTALRKNENSVAPNDCHFFSSKIYKKPSERAHRKAKHLMQSKGKSGNILRNCRVL